MSAGAPLDLDTLPAAAVLTGKQVAAALGVTLRTFDGWRAAGKGPPEIRFGPRCIRYRVSAVREFLANHEA